MTIRRCLSVVFLLPILLLAACDAAPGSESVASLAPVVSDLQYSPANVILAALPPEDVTDDSVHFALNFSVQASDADGEVREVAYILRKPDAQDAVLQSGTLEQSQGRYARSVDVRLPKGGVGNYTLAVYAIDDEGRMSNTLRGLISFTASGLPPVIVEVIADPDTILVERDSILTLTAVVEDPDGIENIARVVVRVPNGAEFEMVDDGQRFGDEVAGDGRYNARFEGVNNATPNTTQTFRFQAFDRTGLTSAIVEKSVRIE